MALRLSDLTVLSETEQIHALTALAVDPSPVRAQIRRYELRYEIPSEEMRRQVAAGQMKETAEIADWLFWLESQSNHVSR